MSKFCKTLSILTPLFIINLIITPILFAAMLSDMTLGDSVSINDRLALVDGVALGDGFTLVDGGDGIKAWDLVTFRPMFRLQLQYDSNVFLNENDEKGDFITSFDAGVEAEMKTGDVVSMAGYVFNMNLFGEHDDQNSYNHTAIGKIDWKLNDYELIIKEKYRRSLTTP